MSTTPNRHLPLMEPSQAQPEVVYNAAMEILDVGGDGTALEVEASGASPGVRDVAKIKFIGATVAEESGGVAVVIIDASTGGPGSLTVDTLTAITKITFTGPAVSVAPGATGEAVVTIDTVSGGSSGTANKTPDTHPLFPGALNDEFETLTLDPKWTVYNALSTVEVIKFSSLVISGTTGSINANTVYGQPLPAPSSPWGPITCKRVGLCSTPFSGLFLGFSATGKGYYFGVNGSTMYVLTQTTFNGAGAAGVYSGAPASTFPLYLSIRYDGTNLIFSESVDGIYYFDRYTIAPATFLGGNPDTVGFFYGSSSSQGVSYDYIRDYT